jgi:hypothetical protein
MSSSNLVRNLHASLLKFCNDFAEENNIASVYFDAHADESTLPPGDLIGMSGLSWEVDEHFLSVNVMIGISTNEDTNLFRLLGLVGSLFELVLPEKKISAYDADSGEVIGVFVVRNGTRALPVGGSSARPLQYIMVGLESTVTFTL